MKYNFQIAAVKINQHRRKIENFSRLKLLPTTYNLIYTICEAQMCELKIGGGEVSKLAGSKKLIDKRGAFKSSSSYEERERRVDRDQLVRRILQLNLEWL